MLEGKVCLLKSFKMYVGIRFGSPYSTFPQSFRLTGSSATWPPCLAIGGTEHVTLKPTS